MARKRAINMTWGKYIVACDVCGQEYYGYRDTAQYCSGKCRQAAYRARKETAERLAKLQQKLFTPEDF